VGVGGQIDRLARPVAILGQRIGDVADQDTLGLQLSEELQQQKKALREEQMRVAGLEQKLADARKRDKDDAWIAPFGPLTSKAAKAAGWRGIGLWLAAR
jgi:hypothetical protein